MTDASRKTLTLIGEALERASQKIQSTKTAPLAPIAHEAGFVSKETAPHSYPTIKDRHAQEREQFRRMTDDDLAFEIVTFEESIESIKLDLEQEKEGLAERPPTWRARAQRALVTIKGQLAVCKLEEASRARADEGYRQFVECACDLLPQETFNAIWKAVNDGGVA